MAEPATPTPAAGKTPRRRGGAQRRGGKPRDDAGDTTEDGADVELERVGHVQAPDGAANGSGEEELFDLLGVSSPASKHPSSTSIDTTDLPEQQPPKQRGLLSITRAQIEASSTPPSKLSRTSSIAIADASSSHTAPRSRAGKGKTKGQRDSKGAVSGDPAKGSELRSTSNTNNPSAFNIESLSKSLPSSSSFFAPKPTSQQAQQEDAETGAAGEAKQKKGKGRGKKQVQDSVEGDMASDATPAKKDRSKGRRVGAGPQGSDQAEISSGIAVGSQEWDIPADAGPAAAENMTWQQQLGHYPYADSPSRSSSTKKSGKAGPSLLKRATAGAGSGAESGPGSDTDITPATTQQAQQEPPNSTSASKSASVRRKGKAKNSTTMPPISFNGIPIGYDGTNHMPGMPGKGTGANASTRPGHQRRQSADSVLSHPSRTAPGSHAHMRQPSLATSASTGLNAHPISNAGAPAPTQAQPTYVPSLMDTLPPFNPAINALRAPQTPAKGGLAGHYKVQALPLLPGEFPRLNAASGSGMAGVGMAQGMAPVGGGYGHVLGQSAGAGGGTGGAGGQYAGANFHNSPAASSLPKPDLDDF